MRSLPLVLASLVLAAHARADLVCHAANTSTAPTNWNMPVVIPAFDPALGTLNAVDVCVTSSLLANYGVESPDSAPVTVTIHVAVQVTLTRPDSSVILDSIAFQNFAHNLSAFDGTIDFGGTSGVFVTGVTALTTTQTFLTTPADLALFTGSPGNPGTLTLPVTGQGVSTATGSGHIITQFATQAAGMISICYDYTPVAAPFCAGDAQATVACPCGNNSAAGAQVGCLNSFGLGASLRGAGTASLAGDSLVLTCTNLPATTNGLLFQGTTQTGSGMGVAFGDGLRCVGGTVTRVSRKTAVAGVISYPQAGDAPISVVGSAAPNSTLHYQMWYRNSAAFCTSSTFNLSQGVSVLWTP